MPARGSPETTGEGGGGVTGVGAGAGARGGSETARRGPGVWRPCRRTAPLLATGTYTRPPHPRHRVRPDADVLAHAWPHAHETT